MSAEEEAEMAAMLDLSKKKKKKKKTKDKEKSSGSKSKSSSSGGDAAEGGSGSAGASEEDLAAQRAIVAADEARQEVTADAHDRKADYTYSELLDRVVGILTRKDLVACSHHKQDALHDGASTPVDLV